MKHFCCLSAAIREGAKLRPQADQLFVETGDGSIGSCALGAAYEAITGETSLVTNDAYIYRKVEKMFPYITGGTLTHCPECGHDSSSVESVVIHLNDDHQWTREAIADWVEKYEESIGYVTLVESESSSKSLQRADVTCVSVNG